MVRHTAALVLAVVLTPSSVSAQSAALTVNAPSATVYKAPTVASPIIGQVPRGTVLDVTREVGDWVKIAWPDDKDGIGYVRLAMGTLSGHPAPVARAPEAPAPAPGPASSSAASRTQRTVPGVAGRTQYVATPTHVVGLGGLMTGAQVGFGLTTRVWSSKRLGVQMEVSRYSNTNTVAPDRLTSMRIAPTILIALPDRVTDYVWLRPYVGGGTSFRQQTLKSAGPDAVEIASERKWGPRVLGGAELTFSSVPRFSLSGDAGYEWPASPFAGVDTGGLMFSVSAHWYVK